MTEKNQNISNNRDNGTRMSRTGSIIGPRPLPPSHSQRNYSDRVSEEYSDSLTPERSRSVTPDPPFPPLISPKPHKPMPTVTKDITNAIETQYSKDINESEISTEFNENVSSSSQDQASQNHNTYSQRPPSPQSPPLLTQPINFDPRFSQDPQFSQNPQIPQDPQNPQNQQIPRNSDNTTNPRQSMIT
ncbi:18979_t:CDS:2, partial [Racocetra persica]